MAADQIFVLLLILVCVIGVTVVEVRSRRRHKAGRELAQQTVAEPVAPERPVAAATTAEPRARRRNR